MARTLVINGIEKKIPEDAFNYKEGLYIAQKEMSAGALNWTVWELFSDTGWCFYDLTQPENYDDSGNLLPENQRQYARYCIMRKNEEYVTKNIICVPIKSDYEII